MNLESLIKDDLHQVFLLSCPCHFPINFALHTWLVVSCLGNVSRYEILFKEYKECSNRFGYLHIDFVPPFKGINRFPFIDKYPWKATLLGQIEGGEGSLAQKMAEWIKNSPQTYQYCKKYSLIGGPNSNTFTQNFLNNFPDFPATLPWNCFGKNYK